MFDRIAPYNDLPMLPPVQVVESRVVLKKAIQAARSLAELKQIIRQLPGPEVLVNTIPLLEARVSSEIENVMTTNEKLFRLAAHAGGATDPATKEAFRYRVALYQGADSLLRRPLGAETAVEVCGVLRDERVSVREVPGTAIGNPVTGGIVYTPPEGRERLTALLANWEEYLRGNRHTEPLVKLAVLHYQFEAIHPFDDGNGRTGRILNLLYLIHEKLLDVPVLYLSRFILQRRGLYYSMLREVTENQAWEPWLLFMLEAVDETSRWTSARVERIRNLMATTRDEIREKLPKIYSHELVEALFRQPYIGIANLVEAGIAKRQTASVYLQQLASIGIVRLETVGREKLFMHTRFMAALMDDGDV
jgi:Fic family protein